MQTFHAASAADWRAWLARHHAAEQKVILVRDKVHTGRPTFSNAAAMDEAICFGWIDTTGKRIDEDRFGVTYVKRGKNSRWSHNTVSHAKRLIKAGKMTGAGLVAFKDGLRRPLHKRFPKNPDVPDDLRKALAKSRKAQAFFDSLAPSYRRIYILMVERMKRPETRMRKARLVAERCTAGKKPAEP